MFSSLNVIACEVCGCASASNSIGAIGSSNGHIIGFSFAGRSYSSAHPKLFSDELERSSEQFYSTSLIAKFQASKRIQVLALVPFQYNSQQNEEGKSITQGLGDITISSRFAPIYQVDSVSKKGIIVQVGAGLKLPTGNYSKEAHETSNLFPGTGSWDIPVELNIYFLTQKWQYFMENSFNLKTKNSIGYHYGNSMQNTVYAMRAFSKNNFKLSLGIGIQYQYLMKDRIDGSSESTFNSGYSLAAMPGTNIQYKNIVLLVRYAQPIIQELSKGYTVAKGQTSISFYYTF